MSQDHANPPVPAPDRLAGRVMAAIANEPVPTPTRALLSATRSGSIHDAASAVWVAWHLATVRRWRIGLRVRARSFALVLAVTVVLGTASVAGAAALRVAAEPIIDLVRPGIVEHAPLEQSPAEAGPALDDENEETDQDDADATGDEDPDSDRPDDVDDEDGPGDEDSEDVDSGDGDSGVDSPDDLEDPDGDEPDGDEDDPGDDPDIHVDDGSDAVTGSDDGEASTD